MLCTTCMQKFPAIAFYSEKLNRYVARCAECRGEPIANLEAEPVTKPPAPMPPADPLGAELRKTVAQNPSLFPKSNATIQQALKSSAVALRKDAPPARARAVPPRTWPVPLRAPDSQHRPFESMYHENFRFAPVQIGSAALYVIAQLQPRSAHGRN